MTILVGHFASSPREKKKMDRQDSRETLLLRSTASTASPYPSTAPSGTSDFSQPMYLAFQ